MMDIFRKPTWLAAVLSGFVAATVQAEANLQITEVYAGLHGEDGTADWIEVANLGSSPFDLSDLRYGDQILFGADGNNAPAGMQLAPSQVKVIVFGAAGGDGDDGPDVTDAFESLWGLPPDLLITGGSGLNETGDTITLHDALGNIVDQVTFTSADTDDGRRLATLEIIDDVIGVSRLGVNGAYASQGFFNDDLGLVDDEAMLVGSPGEYIPVPGPSSAGIAVMLFIGAARRRRRRQT